MFYGWRIVGTVFLTHFVSVGFVLYSFGAFLTPLETTFQSSRWAVSLGLTALHLAVGLSAPILGRLVDTWSARNVMALGAIAFGWGFLELSRIDALWQMYLVMFTLGGVGAAMLGSVPGSTLVSNWFAARRGTALGLATMGISLSGVLMAPIATALIAEWGWRMTFTIYGLVCLFGVLPIVWHNVVNRPEDLGLEPDGPRYLARRQPAIPLPIAAYSSLGTLRSSKFWAIALPVALNLCCLQALLAHFIPHATDLGYSSAHAASLLSTCAGVGVLGKILFGRLADNFGARRALSVAMVLQVLGVCTLYVSSSLSGLLVAASLFGLGMGGVMPLWGALVGETFDRAQFGRVMGLMSPCILPIQLLGVPLAGYVHDVTGTYRSVFAAFAVAYGVAGVILYALHAGLAARPMPAEQSLGDLESPQPAAAPLPPVA